MWDLPRLSQVLTIAEVQAIRQIPLSRHSHEDQLLRHHTSSRQFTVHSAYHHFIMLNPFGRARASSSTFVMHPDGWRLLWRLPIPPKVTWFIWRCLHNAMAINANIARKRIPVDPLIFFCGQRDESVVHLFVECNLASTVMWCSPASRYDFKASLSFNEWCAIDSSLFKQWLKNMQSETGILAHGDLSLKRVLIQGVDMFGKRIGFLKFKADVLDKETGKKVPGIVFARGPAVAVLILLESEGETYVVLTEQVRVPVGRLILELPAGMLDDDKGDFIGTAVREVEEETGIRLHLEDMVDLIAFLDLSTGCRVFPSPGGCDEEISLFLYRGHVGKEIITQLQGKETGLREHGELIKVHVVLYDKLWRITADAKALMAIALYEMAKREGLLPPHPRSSPTDCPSH
ncbi:hypothetical protein HHK36_027841 [Tetracentron sinense]|uniref:Nudix hydrolase domain-containing protein n=1 Tax=Tetracentron sinense TaxID=13715 RepID=A0A834YIS0_TETSI|nr:hypothetical protein HHK36_027841 [Tetracentron sinense]